MANATANRDAQISEGVFKSYKMKASETIFAGTMVMLNSSGTAEKLDTGANNVFVGIAVENKVSGASGDTFVKVRTEGEFEAVASGIASSDVGKVAYGDDDQTVYDAAGTNRVKVGRIVERMSSTRCRVKIVHGV